MALMTLINRLITSLENDQYVLGIYLDFSKAFDTVDHVILLKKLAHYGIRGTALKWFESYLNNREQYVTYNGISSSKQRIKCGIPQGSKLGPLLFFIYINDLYALFVSILVQYHLPMIPIYSQEEKILNFRKYN